MEAEDFALENEARLAGKEQGTGSKASLPKPGSESWVLVLMREQWEYSFLVRCDTDIPAKALIEEELLWLVKTKGLDFIVFI